MKPSLIATLAVGLPESSRVKRKYSGIELTTDQMLLALISDALLVANWQRAGGKKSRKPQSVFQKLTRPERKKDELMSFKSAEDFERWHKEKLEKYNG
jgi:hypothetical protein